MALESEISKIAESSFDASELLEQLERSRIEYDNMKNQKARIEQDRRDQALETAIEMRETIEQLK